MANRSQGADGTRERLLRSAAQVFEARGYHGASVAEICRRSGLANGTFYRYFENKTAAFVALVEEMARRLISLAEGAVRSAADPSSFAQAYLRAFIRFVEANRDLYQIFRETEFVDRRVALRFYDSLALAVARGLGLGEEGQPLDGRALATADFVVGTPILWAADRLIWARDAQETAAADVSQAVETLAAFLADGLGGDPAPLDSLLARAGAAIEQPPADGAPGRLVPSGRGSGATGLRLLRAAELTVGRRGFHATSVADVTRRARVGLGTFYLYFRSKQEMLRALVEAINEGLRRHLGEQARQEAGPGADRRLVECLGFVGFIRFIHQHADIYRVVREAEFVDEGLARWYYRRLAQPYAAALAEAMRAGQVRTGDPMALAYALMGVGHFIGVRWVVWKEGRPGLTNPLMRHVCELLLRGVRGAAGT